jgi:hypothetical protein
MVFAEFQKWSTGWNGIDYSGPAEVIPMLGSDGVFIIIGPRGLAGQLQAARDRIELLKSIHGDTIIGFKLCSGRSFLHYREINGGRLYPVGRQIES